MTLAMTIGVVLLALAVWLGAGFVFAVIFGRAVRLGLHAPRSATSVIHELRDDVEAGLPEERAAQRSQAAGATS
jgi:hypothetical protein